MVKIDQWGRWRKKQKLTTEARRKAKAGIWYLVFSIWITIQSALLKFGKTPDRASTDYQIPTTDYNYQMSTVK